MWVHEYKQQHLKYVFQNKLTLVTSTSITQVTNAISEPDFDY